MPMISRISGSIFRWPSPFHFGRVVPLHVRYQSSLNKGNSDASADQNHAVVSAFDLFSIGIGPSSSHTVGPMRAARIFIEDLRELKLLDRVGKLRIDLYGSLALTGVGHGTPQAILMGMEGETPEKVDTGSIDNRVDTMYRTKELCLGGIRKLVFDPSKDLVFHMYETLPQHSNGMRFSVFDESSTLLATNEYFSIGGGFVVNARTRVSHGENVYYRDGRVDGSNFANNQASDDHQQHAIDANRMAQDQVTAAIPFTNAEDLLRVCERRNMTIAQVVFKNELQWRSADQVRKGISNLWQVMNTCIMNGMHSSDEFLPGSLRVRRRAPILYRRLMQSTVVRSSGVHDDILAISDQKQKQSKPIQDDRAVASSEDSPNESEPVQQLLPSPSSKSYRRRLPALDWLSLYAIAVNEENAAGGRVVTSPTNGAAGVIPAVLKYYLEFISTTHPHQQSNEIIEFLLTSAAIGMLYKRGSSISAAEVGCQGEVGVACSMAAAGLAAVMGGTVEQIENAAEIGMEHNLGLTCDPVGGLVQIPCIERNALGAVKAVTAAQLALHGDGIHRVSLDQVIETMRQTGIDMQAKYKETSLGGLAVNVPLC